MTNEKPIVLDAEAVAAYVIKQGNKLGVSITNQRLNRILYFVQGMALATLDRPAFSDDFEAWNYGPILPVVYGKYTYHGVSSIPDGAATRFVMNWQAESVYGMATYVEYEEIDEELKKIVNQLIKDTKKYTDFRLTEIVMDSHPWRNIFDNKNIHKIVSKTEMAKYFKKLNKIPLKSK